MISRRTFLFSAGGTCALPAAAGAVARPDRSAIENEIRRRAAGYLGQRYLVVDYYRIRRRLAFPLPVKDLSIRTVPVPTIADYPWATWMTWELEERVNALGWAAEWFHDQRFAAAAARDLEALAAWPRYCQYPNPDLSSAHAARLLWTAYRKWRWPGAETRERIRAGCARHVEEVLPRAARYYDPLKTSEDFLALAAPHSKVGNIALIGIIGAALSAGICGHAAAAELNSRVRAVFGAVLELRSKGYAEGVAYDGYILDFLADWLESVPAGERAPILQHSNFKHYLEESYMLGAPGAAQEVAELSDVEARQMPFHFSAQVKLAALSPDPVRAWHIRRWPHSWMRANALGALATAPAQPAPSAPTAGGLQANYAVVLRSGWEAQDLAVVASCTNSPAAHIQHDNGTLVIGTRGKWILSDPGYQQYARGAERQFTIGPDAHNYPVIDGAVQTAKAGRCLSLEKDHTRLDLTACYKGLDSVVREVWLAGRNLVVVADRIRAAGAQRVSYRWHGHPEAAWDSRDGWLLLHTDDADLWFGSPQARLSDADIRQIDGTRGQLTAFAELKPLPPAVWWVFAIGDAPPAVELAADGGSIRVAGQRFTGRW